MKTSSPKTQLHREVRRLFRSMDFVSRHPALEKDDAEARRFAEIYQQLGLAWEFLALQCKHWDGFRKTRDGRAKCPICGTFEDAAHSSMLLRAAEKSGSEKAPCPRATRLSQTRNPRSCSTTRSTSTAPGCA